MGKPGTRRQTKKPKVDAGEQTEADTAKEKKPQQPRAQSTGAADKSRHRATKVPSEGPATGRTASEHADPNSEDETQKQKRNQSVRAQKKVLFPVVDAGEQTEADTAKEKKPQQPRAQSTGAADKSRHRATKVPSEGPATGRTASEHADPNSEDETQKQKRNQSVRAQKKTTSRDMARRKKATITAKYSPEVENAVEKFMTYVLETTVTGLYKEFEDLKDYATPAYNFEACKRNPTKNRFADVHCLDATRVVLRSDYGNYTAADGDYVNANWVNIEHADRKYIACQAPMANTIEDFWRMVFQENVVTIFVLCNFVENDNAKCAEYWPLKYGEYKNYGKMFVNNKKVEPEDKYDMYTLEVLPDGCSNSIVVKLIHCFSWPDQSVPNSGRLVLRMLKVMKDCGPGTAIVHCAAGIGRTGTILAIDIVAARLFKGKETKVSEIFKQLRDCRASLIQREGQYLFIYSTVLDYIKAKMAVKWAPDVGKFYKELDKREKVS
ncbi:unnamed protein product, partial [Mesorhabditis spiculigera]